MSTDKIISRKNGPIGHLVFNNPGKRKNAATERVVAALTEAWPAAEKSNSARALYRL